MAFGFLIPEASSAPPKARKRYLRWSTIWGFCAGLPIAALTALYDEDVSQALLAALAVVVILAFFAATREFVILMRSLDELQSRIHLAALAMGFGFTAVLVMAWEVATLAALLPDFQALLVFPIGIAGYYAALHLVLRRYS